MGSATREALANAAATLHSQSRVSLAAGEQLLAAALLIDGAPHLRSALADDTAEDANRKGIIDALFSAYTPVAKAVLETVAVQRWSSEDDLVEVLEELGIRAIAASAPKTLSIEDELFAFEAAVASNAELELALGSKLGTSDGRLALVQRLLTKRFSEQTVAIVGALIAQPRGRRIGELIGYATSIVADEAGLTVATVTVAKPIGSAQLRRLVTALSEQYGRGVRINQIVDPRILGGLRVQVGDEVIDGSISNRIADLRLRLVG
jgi:F-type H+-transporting ATPase subunit delta